RGGTHLRAGGQPQPAAGLRRGLRRVGRARGRLVQRPAPAHRELGAAAESGRPSGGSGDWLSRPRAPVGPGTPLEDAFLTAPPHPAYGRYRSRERHPASSSRAARPLPPRAGVPGISEGTAMVNTIASVIQHKGSTVWFLSPSASVYDAVDEMAKRGVGA